MCFVSTTCEIDVKCQSEPDPTKEPHVVEFRDCGSFISS